MSKNLEYQRGYAAGQRLANKKIKRLEVELEDLAKEFSASAKQNERVYLSCLEMAVKHCHGWKIGDEKVNNTQMYCKLAKSFADNSISILEE